MTTETTTTEAQAAPDAAPATQSQPLLNGSEGSTPAEPWFKNIIPPELHELPVLKKYGNDAATFVRSFENAQRLIGADKIAIPPAEDTAAWDAVYNRLGRPETPEGYKLEVAKDLEGKVQIDKDLQTGYAKTAHSLGITGKQAAALFQWFTGEQAKAEESMVGHYDNEAKEAEAAIRKEWGSSFDENKALADRAKTVLLDAQDLAALNATGLGNDIRFIRIMAKVGKALGEDSSGGEQKGTMGMTPSEAKAKRTEIMSNVNGAYWKNNHPDHKAAVEEMYKLNTIISGTEE